MNGSTETKKELSKSPQLNLVLEEAVKVINGIGDPDALHDRLVELEHVTGFLLKTFQHESQYQEETDPFKQEQELILSNFERIKEGIYRFKQYFDDNNAANIEDGMTKCMGGFRELFASFDRLKEEELKRKVYSDSPYINEIFRVADLVKQGKLPKERLKERIDAYLFIHKNFMVNYQYMKPTIDERPIYDEHKEELKSALEQVMEGLQLAQTYFMTGITESLDAGLEKTRNAADFLLDFEEMLREVREAPKVKLCFQCGAENPRSARYCEKCNYNFPPLQMEEDSTVDLRLEESGIRQTGHAMTENVVRLYNAVDDVKSGAVSKEEFMNTINWFQGLISRAKEDQAKIPDPPEDSEPEAQEAFQQFKQVFLTGMKYMEEGLQKMKLYPETGNTDLLQGGMEDVFSGGDLLFQVKMTGEKVAMSMKRSR